MADPRKPGATAGNSRTFVPLDGASNATVSLSAGSDLVALLLSGTHAVRWHFNQEMEPGAARELAAALMVAADAVEGANHG